MKKDKTISDVIMALNTVSNLTLSPNEYDAVMCKEIKSSNLIGGSRTSHQAHIAITGKDMGLFPAIWTENYQNPNVQDEDGGSMKSFFYLMVPVTLYKKNIQYSHTVKMDDNDFNSNDTITTNMSVKLSRRGSGSRQIELGHLSQSDSLFKKFRAVFDEHDILIIAKKKEQLAYDAFIIRATNSTTFPNSSIFDTKGNSTVVKAKNYHYYKSFKHGGKNVIYYGAPGTGKSYKLSESLRNTKYNRVTFYPDYDYTDFVGGLKPKNINGHINYPYVGGILTTTLSEAINNPSENVVLLIEELNRANAPSVFGDTFQLLDRDPDGGSTYSIKNEELGSYLNRHTNYSIDFVKEGIRFPSNFSIMATMNPADQGVYHLDTAFTRRWQMAYVPIDWTSEDVPKAEVAGFSYPWNVFGQALNHILAINGIEEDEMLGQHFMTATELKDIKLVASKLLGYLWNNVLRYKRQAIFNAETLSDLMYQFEHQNKGIKIFNGDTQEQLSQAIKDAQNRLIPNDQEHPDEDNYENN